jgi:hypothetical protein
MWPRPSAAPSRRALEKELCMLLLTVVRSMARRGSRMSVSRGECAGLHVELALKFGLKKGGAS